VDRIPDECAIRASSCRGKSTVIRSTTSGASLPDRSTSRSQPWTGRRLIGCRGSSTDYATIQPAAKLCAPSPLAALPGWSLASRRRMPRPPAPRGGTAAHATVSAVAAMSSAMPCRVPVTAAAIAAAVGRYVLQQVRLLQGIDLQRRPLPREQRWRRRLRGDAVLERLDLLHVQWLPQMHRP
jgi:hypothetical protein